MRLCGVLPHVRGKGDGPDVATDLRTAATGSIGGAGHDGLRSPRHNDGRRSNGRQLIESIFHVLGGCVMIDWTSRLAIEPKLKGPTDRGAPNALRYGCRSALTNQRRS